MRMIHEGKSQVAAIATGYLSAGLIGPLEFLVGASRSGNVLAERADDIACGRVVANCVLVQVRLRAGKSHLGAAVDGDTADMGGVLPEHLGQMAVLLKQLHVERARGVSRRLLVPPVVDISLTLVPGLGDAGRDIVCLSGESEEVLTLAFDGVVLKVAEFGSRLRRSLTLGAPLQVGDTVVSTSTVVVPQSRILVVLTTCEVGLDFSRDVLYAIDGSSRGRR